MMAAAVAADQQLRLREVDTEAQFALLREPWNSLAAHAGGTAFQRHEWLAAAWAWCRDAGQQPWIVAVFRGDQLVGALPLHRPVTSLRGTRRLGFLSIPDSQWCDGLVCPQAGPAVGRLLAAWLLRISPQWDVLRLERLVKDSAVVRWLVPALDALGVPTHLEAADCNRSVDLESSWTDYCAGLSRSLRKTRNLAANRLRRAGAVQIEWITAETVGHDGLRPLLDDLTSVSARSWKCATGNSLDRPAPQAFLRALTETAFAKRWLSVWLLRLDGRPVAMEYQLSVDGAVHALRADFDARFADLCPGTYLNYHMLERLFAERSLRRYYMGPGRNPYKARWSQVGDAVHTLTAFAPTVRGRGSKLWFDLKPKLGTLKDRLLP